MDAYADGRTVSPRRRAKARLLARLIERLCPEGAIRLADLGCADGAIPVALLASPLGSRVTEAVGVTLLDYNDLPEKPAFGNPRFRRLVADLALPLAETCPELAPASYDLVTATSLLQYMEAPALALENAMHLLRPGGHLVATVPARWIVRARARRPWRRNTRILHVQSLRAWREAVRASGFEMMRAFRAQLGGFAFAPLRALEELLERAGALRLVGTNLVIIARKPG